MTNPASGTHTLVLLRHAKSGCPPGVADHDRPLAERGRREAPLAGRWLADRLPPVDGIFCSTAVRTRQTLEATGLVAPTVYTDDIYEAAPETLLELVNSADETLRTLLLVGHAPGLPALADRLAGPDSAPDALDALHTKFPTSAIAVLTVPGRWADLAPGGGTLTALHVARD
ncbi:SixA phosphatase family protein [Nakamurella leprariae]|uniref:Histidine phosphatase family protein n=1 Tax=Nakamurella leprariae TaxID=2803911 RepID=A0A938YGH7_9ACTN|nr:histidine phosphatase family protein [Nakamurella leprariae]MBM9467947.1 histidine phosphatase family protein [Nakamurella leprariae]